MAKFSRQRERLRRCDPIFIPQRRMREIRWEESVVHSRAKRAGTKATMAHISCSCGSLGCVAVPIDTSPRPRRRKSP